MASSPVMVSPGTPAPASESSLEMCSSPIRTPELTQDSSPASTNASLADWGLDFQLKLEELFPDLKDVDDEEEPKEAYQPPGEREPSPEWVRAWFAFYGQPISVPRRDIYIHAWMSQYAEGMNPSPTGQERVEVEEEEVAPALFYNWQEEEQEQGPLYPLPTLPTWRFSRADAKQWLAQAMCCWSTSPLSEYDTPLAAMETLHDFNGNGSTLFNTSLAQWLKWLGEDAGIFIYESIEELRECQDPWTKEGGMSNLLRYPAEQVVGDGAKLRESSVTWHRIEDAKYGRQARRKALERHRAGELPLLGEVEGSWRTPRKPEEKKMEGSWRARN